MKGETWRKVLSLVLAIILSLELIPTSALAIGSDTGRATSAEEAASEKETYGNTAQKKVPNTAECDIIKSWINKCIGRLMEGDV